MNRGYCCVITLNGGLTGINSERMNVCAGNTVGEIESSPRKCAKKAGRRIRRRGIQCEPPERNKRERWASESESYDSTNIRPLAKLNSYLMSLMSPLVNHQLNVSLTCHRVSILTAYSNASYQQSSDFA